MHLPITRVPDLGTSHELIGMRQNLGSLILRTAKTKDKQP